MDPEDARELKEYIKESTIIGLVYTLAELVSGGFLLSLENSLLVVPGLAIMLPGILDLRGNISSTLGARLGSALHMGWMKPRFEWKGDEKENIVASVVLSVTMNIVVAIIASVTAWLLGINADLVLLVEIALLAGILAMAILMPLSLAITIESYKHGWDPNNVTAPAIATLGDIAMIACMVIAVKILVG